MIVKMLEITKFNVWRHSPLFGCRHPWEILIDSLWDYLPVISTLVCNDLLDHLQREVIICVTYLHVYLHPYNIRAFKGSDDILLILVYTW